MFLLVHFLCCNLAFLTESPQEGQITPFLYISIWAFCACEWKALESPELMVCVTYDLRISSEIKSLMPNTHCQRRRDETVELCRVGGVNDKWRHNDAIVEKIVKIHEYYTAQQIRMS